MTTPAFFKFGGIEYPLAGVVSTSSLLDFCDPAVKAAGAFFSSVIGTYLGTAMTLVAANCGADIVSNVQQFLPYDPALVAKYVQGDYPQLAVWRKTAAHNDRTLSWEHEVSKWGIAYILPPLDAGQLERIQPVLHSVCQIVQHSIRARSDAAYLADADVWASVGIEKFALLSSEFAGFAIGGDAGGLYFPAWQGELEVSEKFNPTAGGTNPYTGDDAMVSDESAQEGNPVEVVPLDIEVTP